jgi:zinc protease
LADREKDLPRLDLRALPGPDDVLRRELSNGIVVLARENFASPSVVFSGYLTVGSLEESRQQAGRAHLTAKALMRGTKNASFHEIYSAIESIGASLGFGAGPHSTSFQGKTLVEQLPTLLDLFSDVLRHPSFPEDQVGRLRSEHLTALAIRDQDTRSMARLAFKELAYPDHPYRLSSSGYRDSVEHLGPSDLRRHHAGFGPSGMVVSVVGALEAEAAIELIASRFEGWHVSDQASSGDLPPVDAPERIQLEHVPLPGKIQADIVLGMPGPSRFDEHYMAAALGNSILGRFGLFGRIGDAVREREGLAYYAYSSISGGPGPGPWNVSAGVNPVNVDKAIELIRAEIRRFVSEAVSEEELFENQANYIGRLPLQLESNEGVAGALVHAERYALGLDYYQRYPALVAGITREQVLETARRFLDPDRIVGAVAGPAVELE